MRHSIQPVLDAQSRHWFEVGKVAGEQGGVVSEADAGDLQILGADLLAERFQRFVNGVSESAGINRLETENERVLQRKLSQ